MRSLIWVGFRAPRPFGAAHRLNFDTPPLIGCCRGTCVPCSELVGLLRDRGNRVPWQERAFTSLNGGENGAVKRRAEPLRRRFSRYRKGQGTDPLPVLDEH
jgi:hypothetical protein